MGNKYIDENSKLLEAILAKKPSKVKVKLANDIDNFIREFYHLEPEEDLKAYTVKELYNIASGAFEFCKKRKVGVPKIRIFNPLLKKNGWERDYTVVEILNDDKPFLVDSISEELNRQDFEVYNIFHPVIGVERDKNGVLQSVHPEATKKKAGFVESLIHLHVPQISDSTRMKELEKDILGVIKAIEYSVSDWKKMLAKLDGVTAHFALSATALEINHSEKEKLKFREYANEIKEFLEWLKDNNFVFLGYIEYKFEDKQKEEKLQIVKGSRLGIFRLSDPVLRPKKTTQLSPQGLHFIKGEDLIEITKANRKSLVHRPVHMDYIGIKKFDVSGRVIGEHRFLGLFTSQVYYQSAELIPIIRRKIAIIQKKSRYHKSGHSSKALTAILESFPRDELFQTPVNELFNTVVGIVALGVRQRVRLFVRKDDFERFVSCIIYIPRERMSTDLRSKMEEVLAKAYNGTVSNRYTQITESHLARLQVIIKTVPGELPDVDVRKIENELAKAARSWFDDLEDVLVERKGSRVAEDLLKKYENAFSVSYTNRFSAIDIYYDILQLEKIRKNKTTIFDFYKSDESSDVYDIKIYNPDKQIFLSQIMPIIENMELEVIAEHTYLVTLNEDKSKSYVWIHHFRFKAKIDEDLAFKYLKQNFEECLNKVWNHEIQNDRFNALIVKAGLKWRQVVLIRAYSRYLKQSGFPYSLEFMEKALSSYPKLAHIIVDIFEARFNPYFENKTRTNKGSVLRREAEKLLAKVANLSEDRVIRGFIDLIFATLRSNFYQKDKDGNLKNYISFKLCSAKIPNLPLPIPYAEIFVYSPRVEGIHLRGGKVARGGLRWSDRTEDFRTEILGLMKAQMTKNSVIVPVGSKGGFIVKAQASSFNNRDEFMLEGIECYKTFLRGLLDITDNIVENKVNPPADVVRYDDDDSYLVVAADKGTATFSDIANSVSAEYGFWLSDAFASGGSQGYDHKKMGITARGAWISVERHFRELGIDTDKQVFTVIGIGDMSGDVFGNGMLRSKCIKLVAAFNHMHIFVDPNPSLQKSFVERERLFALARSTWKDYNPKLISKGGGVFDRSAKSIKLTKEIKELVNSDNEFVTPDELIKLLLCAKIDLLWNGGIGTYVKSSQETHEVVGDRANDAVRVNASQLKFRVIGEGGNLGFTQLGRIEYARLGGKINTDAIDNSAGVDCSDHEVNLKIALNSAVEKGKITMLRRNRLLEEMTEDVADLVLRDNILQTQAITIAEHHGSALLEITARFMSKLEKEGLLDRRVEFLPGDDDIARLHSENKGLTRPELAVVLAYSKMVLNDQLLKSNLPDDPYFVNDLLFYFPQKMQDEFKHEIKNHTLKKEIVANFVTNSIVNRVGSTFFYQIAEDTGMGVADIVRAYVLTRDIFKLRELWRDIENLNGKIPVMYQVELFQEIEELVERCVLWFLRNLGKKLDIAKVYADFANGVNEMSKSLTKMLSPMETRIYKKRLARYRSFDVPTNLCLNVAGFNAMASACNIVHVANKGGLPIDVVGKIYFELGARLEFGWIRSILDNMSASAYWRKLSVKTLINNLYDQQMNLTAEVIKQKCKGDYCEVAIKQWVNDNAAQIDRYDRFINDLKSQDKVDISMLIVAMNRIEEICG